MSCWHCFWPSWHGICHESFHSPIRGKYQHQPFEKSLFEAKIPQRLLADFAYHMRCQMRYGTKHRRSAYSPWSTKVSARLWARSVIELIKLIKQIKLIKLMSGWSESVTSKTMTLRDCNIALKKNAGARLHVNQIICIGRQLHSLRPVL